jgi:cytochrome c oxidase subunit II
MALAIILIVLTVGSVIFHIVTPWWFTPIASNWGFLDDTVFITVVITGVVFVLINLFIAYALIKFRHREGNKAAYEPENRKLEWWLTGLTTAGIVAMLAPGLWAYADLIETPKDASIVEVLGQQWQWRYRFPGKDGELGQVHVRFVNLDNPFGLDPEDPKGKDDILINGGELHLPLGKPVKVLLRSHDVLHNFYVPQIRSKMDIVPGLVSYFWFTPTKAGKYESLCAEYCGVAHFNMRAHIVLEEQAQFAAWIDKMPTFAQSMTPKAASADPAVARGRQLAQDKGCIACHSLDGSKTVGPSWKGLYGKEEELADGRKVKVDDAYLRESIVNPNAAIVKGFPPAMPPSQLDDQEMAALIAFMKSVQ